ncbi:hypothetical protein B0H16DRAFT_1323604 [Mycena metata]|uniref:DUF7779 domain-containing protein n=1 Tax=Mycena metata TaxID=1033252 RepID=A0AAD7N1M6_9AGAR|nr:hypothetical protein B0H16DRAFT_1323604 [Mycena metata]
MHQYFTRDSGKQHIFVLHGLGGAGKTQTALKFIAESSRFSDIFLIDASTLDTIDAGLKSIVAAKNTGSTAQDALKYLSSKADEWLLFFDNADDLAINLNTAFPRCNHGNILVTSRNPGLCVYAGSHSVVSDIEETDAINLLLASAAQEATSGNKLMAAEIALCYLPLAIVQSGAFIARSGVLKSYLALYTQNRIQLLSDKPSQSHDDYNWTVYTTWQISFKQLTLPAAKLLQLCSFVHHQEISEKIFSNASKYKCQLYGPSEQELQEPLEFLAQFLGKTGVWDTLHFMELLTELRAYSLINFNTETELFSIHPLVHSWSRSTVPDQKTHHSCMVAIVGMSIASLADEEKGLWLLPHIDSLRQGETHVTPDFNYEYGRIYYNSGRPRIEEGLYIAVLEKRRKVLGDDHPDTLQIIGNLAWTYHKLGQLNKAEELQAVLLKKRSDSFGEEHPDTLRTMANLASTYYHLGWLRKAEELGSAVLEKQKTNCGEDHPDTLWTTVNLANAYRQLGQLSKAEDLQNSVLEKQKRLLGESDPDILFTMDSLSNTYREQGKLEQAQELGMLVLEKQKKHLGEDHPDTLETMDNLTLTHHMLGQLKEAEELAAVAFEKGKAILGENHPETLRAMGNLADTYRALGKFMNAQDLQIEAIEKQKKIIGKEHPDTMRTMGNLAVTYRELGQLEKAEELGAAVLKLCIEVLGDDHPYTLRTMGNLAWTWHKLQRVNNAEELGATTLKKQRAILGDTHPDTLVTQRNLEQIHQEVDILNVPSSWI